jgi:hypothetical protein
MSAYGGRYAEGKLRREIVEVGRRMYHKGFIAASDGNISVRLTADRLLIMPRGLHKGFLTSEQLVATDVEDPGQDDRRLTFPRLSGTIESRSPACPHRLED